MTVVCWAGSKPHTLTDSQMGCEQSWTSGTPRVGVAEWQAESQRETRLSRDLPDFFPVESFLAFLPHRVHPNRGILLVIIRLDASRLVSGPKIS